MRRSSFFKFEKKIEILPQKNELFRGCRRNFFGRLVLYTKHRFLTKHPAFANDRFNFWSFGLKKRSFCE